MHWKKHSPTEITAVLDRVQEALSHGVRLGKAIRDAGVSSATYFRWRSQYGSLGAEQVELIKRLEQENARLRRAISEMEVAA